MAKTTRRKSLSKVRVGSGITGYNRQPSIVDAEYREKVISGALVDGRVEVSPAIPFQQFREGIELFCREVYQDNKLPDPFDFAHPQGKFTPLCGRDLMARDETHLKSRYDLGYLLVATIYCPPEDHSLLWYASRLAVELTRFDLTRMKARAESEGPELLVYYSVHIGAELGRLDKERRLKFKHEDSALLGGKFVDGSSKGGRKTAETYKEAHALRYAEMDRRITDGETYSHAARQVVRTLDLNISPKSLVKSYRRNRGL